MLNEFHRQPQKSGAAYALSLRVKMRALLQIGGRAISLSEGGEIKKTMIRGKAKLVMLSAVVIVFALALLPAIALAYIPPICRFVGLVTVDGNNVPDGTVVNAWLEEDPHLGPWTATVYKRHGTTWYLLDVPMDDPDTPDKDGAVDGDTVCFNVKYDSITLVGPSSTWEEREIVHHPLHFTMGCIPGDANEDGVVDMSDVTKVERIILELDDPTPCADAKQEGEINMADVTKIGLIILGIDC